jgi:hypothetical protein
VQKFDTRPFHVNGNTLRRKSLKATFNEPHHYATGFACVLVNGVVVVKNDALTGARPGQALRHGRARESH